jgi:hypothetical protein
MRSGGNNRREWMRAPTSAVSERGRAGGDARNEWMRTPESAVTERGRVAGAGPSERMVDPFLRMHPPAPGCSIFTIQGIAGIGTAGCMVAGLDLGYRP